MTLAARAPVRVDARLDAPLSRWLWLVKWVLVIPHLVVLTFLWIAFAVVTVVALVAILVSGRYPQTIFDFTLGVLRWSWRVSYYTTGAFGTDRYPPFSLGAEPDYPATLDIAYPEHLSRGLVLVKWWLLAIPHYLVLGFLLGGGGYLATRNGGGLGGGLIGLLVLFAVVILLFTGRYPRGLFDLVLGLDRWVLRVAAYVALMTDTYPPFRLDLGGTDPAALLVGDPVPDQVPAPVAPTAPQRPRWTAGRVVSLVIGSVLVLGHPYVDVWQAVRPERVGLDAWPVIERGTEWKRGILRELGWPADEQADVARAWQRILRSVRSYADLEPSLLGRVEELIDFVTA